MQTPAGPASHGMSENRQAVHMMSSEDRRAIALVLVEAGGVLRLDGESDALTTDNEILSNIADAATEGEIVPLPITRAMAAAWRAAIAAQPGSEALLELGVSAQQLVLTLAVRYPQSTLNFDGLVFLFAWFDLRAR